MTPKSGGRFSDNVMRKQNSFHALNPTLVHGLDSFGPTPHGGKVLRFANSAADAARIPGAGRNAGDNPDGEREAAFSSAAGWIPRRLGFCIALQRACFAGF